MFRFYITDRNDFFKQKSFVENVAFDTTTRKWLARFFMFIKKIFQFSSNLNRVSLEVTKPEFSFL